jgi:hypothetical protein
MMLFVKRVDANVWISSSDSTKSTAAKFSNAGRYTTREDVLIAAWAQETLIGVPVKQKFKPPPFDSPKPSNRRDFNSRGLAS